ncbi:MAG TPA: cell division protein FtsQ/DivIB [Steroidobacteraceae bacterium]|nr:cell division protein FtsQ/DivIB [Steroidobacteraceae bacterium]
MSLFRRRKPAGAARSRARSPGWLARLPGIPWRRLAPAGLLLLALGGALVALRFTLDGPVRQVAISGRFQRVQPLDVEKAVRGALHGEGMLGVDLGRVAQAVESVPWVDRASVARSWPEGLRVQVVEQKPVARWGESGLVNVRGEVFVQDAQHIPAELPELVGPQGFAAEMTARCLAVQPRLEQGGLRLARLTLDERGAWQLTLENGITLRLGRQNVDQRFDRFVAAAARIVVARAADIAYVDMRYASGFAIGWRSGASEVQRG